MKSQKNPDWRTIEKAMRDHQKKTLSTLASGIAHELNNILAGMHGYSRLLDDSGEDPKMRERALGCFRTGIQRAGEIVRRIGHFASLDDPDWEVIDMQPIVKDIVNAISEDATHAGITIETDFNPLPLTLADVALLSTALLELLQNAKEAILDSANNECVMRVITRMEDGEAVVLIQDSGDGLPQELLAEGLDAPFFTTKGPTASGNFPKAQGLGLSSAYGIARELNGTLTVRNRPNSGAEARLALPAASPLFDRKKGRVLIIDDEAAIRRIFTTMIERAGFNAHAVENARDGIAALEEYDFDLILLDQMMPGMSGLQFLEWLQSADLDAPPVVMITAGYSPDLARQALQLGAVACTSKPINRKKIMYFADMYSHAPSISKSCATESIEGVEEPKELRILIVDPDPLSGEALEMILNRTGQRCRLALNSHDAIAEAKGEYFDMILIDMMLHDAHGISTIHELRVLAPYTPILVTTSKLSAATLQQAYAAGATRAIEKPINSERILHEVTNLSAIFAEISNC